MQQLLKLSQAIDRLNNRIGLLLSWLLLIMVLLGVYNAVTRKLSQSAGIDLSSNMYIEAQWYLFSLVFLWAGAYALHHGVHVRVDILYSRMAPRSRAWVDILGTLFFLLPLCLLIIWVSTPYALDSWRILEDSPDPGGLPPVGDGRVNEGLAAVLFGDGPIPEIPARSTPYGEDGFRPEPGELEWMRSWDSLSKKGLLSLEPTTRVSDQQWLRMGGRDWQAIHTPGHTGDHLCLWDPESGVLLSGDHVLPTITPHISGLTVSSDSLADFVAALRRVAALEGVEMVLPAHGLPFTDLPGRVEEIVEHHDQRLERLRGIAAGLGTAGVRAFSHELFQERSWGPMAESETYAHLEHLRLAGRMTRSSDDRGRFVYSLVD